MGIVPMAEPMVGAKEAAEKLGISDRTLKRMAQDGDIPAMKIGTHWRFLPSLLDAWRKQRLMSNCPELPGQEEK